MISGVSQCERAASALIVDAIEVMVDRIDDEGVVARSHWDAPEIDGNVYLDGNAGLALGDRLEVLVEDADEYDLYARPAGAKPKPPEPRRAAKAPLAPSH